jgi:hypothetical protein
MLSVFIIHCSTDAILFNFLEQYIRRLEGPIAMQVWPRYMQLTKEIVSSVKDYKAQSFDTLRCLSALAEKVTQTAAMEDRRIRKELQASHSPLQIYRPYSDRNVRILMANYWTCASHSSGDHKIMGRGFVARQRNHWLRMGMNLHFFPETKS